MLDSEYRFGTLDEARALIGTGFIARTSWIDVSEALIQLFASVLQDANPGFWDQDFARRQWGGIISPPSMLMTWLSPLPWSPARLGLPQVRARLRRG